MPFIAMANFIIQGTAGLVGFAFKVPFKEVLPLTSFVMVVSRGAARCHFVAWKYFGGNGRLDENLTRQQIHKGISS